MAMSGGPNSPESAGEARGGSSSGRGQGSDYRSQYSAYGRTGSFVGGQSGGGGGGGQSYTQIGDFFSGTMDQLSNLMGLSRAAQAGLPETAQAQQQTGFFDTVSNMFSNAFSPFEKTEGSFIEDDSPLEDIGTSIKEFLGLTEDPDKIQSHWPGMNPTAAESLPEYNAMSVLGPQRVDLETGKVYGWAPGEPFEEGALDTLIGAYKKHEIDKRGMLGQIFGTGIDEPRNFKEKLAQKLAGLAFSPIGMSGTGLPFPDPIGNLMGAMISNAIRTDRIDQSVINPSLRALGFDDQEIDAAWRGYYDTGNIARGEGRNEQETILDPNETYIDEETGKPILNPYYIYRYSDQYTDEQSGGGSSLEGPLEGSALRRTGDDEEEETLGDRLLLDIFADDLLENLEVW
jgi:hypothetical protein